MSYDQITLEKGFLEPAEFRCCFGSTSTND